MPAKASRAAFGEALIDLGARDERIVTLDADLSKSTMTAKFAKTYPGRAFNLGIAESNMIGVAAGLALAGRIPFACSFACFLVGRFETIRVSVAYSQAPVKLVGTHVGRGHRRGRLYPDGAGGHRLHPLAPQYPHRPARRRAGDQAGDGVGGRASGPGVSPAHASEPRARARTTAIASSSAAPRCSAPGWT